MQVQCVYAADSLQDKLGGHEKFARVLRGSCQADVSKLFCNSFGKAKAFTYLKTCLKGWKLLSRTPP